MSISDVIEATNIPNDGEEPHGIIYEIRNRVTNDNILNYVNITSNATSFSGSLEALVKWGSISRSSANKEAYVQIEFKNRFVFPTYYSFKGESGGHFAKQWQILGLNSENETPTVLATNSFRESPSYCCDDTCCCNENWGTFKINPKTNKGFRFIRINCTESSYPSVVKWRVGLRGFEIFGKLSINGNIKKPKRTYCFKSYPINHHLPTYAFLRMFSVYLS